MAQPQIVESAEITVQYVNPPKAGKKWGSIKATDGAYYSGPPAMLDRFRQGETCKIEYTLGGSDGTLKAIKQKIETPAALQRLIAAPPRAPANPSDGERMGTMGMVNSFIRSGTVDMQRDSIKNVIKICRDAYNDIWGTPAKQKSEQEFNDQIPY